ncbi:cupin domain-containing protein [Calothrix sp. FACHB-1219]|uniref:cupin domain-containing protein n=1 Tax=unclassified Calothrix TaxID=2619626 RepID=UPI001688E0BE|nr:MULTISPECIES: cupin domain-containing protein [unclassified Calothrix]MBD2204627.1 cupin domain-containing protein [Calothrix sp. FACHB-168]MBD2216861.1 cupin domain-containing protein [Calothrix sp. FACHB-1219]
MNSEDLSELVSLYALNTLDAAEASMVESDYAQLAEFQLELAEYESVVAMLAYTAPPVPLASEVKDRLFARIASEDKTTDLLQQAQNVTWEAYAPTPGVELGILKIDPQQREVQCFVRSLGKVKFPQHRHAGEEEIVVLDGDLVIGENIYKSGDRISSLPGTVHQPETLHGCTLFLRTSLDDEILSPSVDNL